MTGANLAEVPALVRFFIRHADAVHLASFQLQADTGRGVLGKAAPGVSQRRLIELINAGAGVDLGFEFPAIGHPDCNRYSGCLVAGDAVTPLFDDAAFTAGWLAATEGYTFDRRDRRALLRTCVGIALRNPHRWGSGLAFAARKLWELRRGLFGGHGVHKLSFYIHQFMDADRLERARCESCVFMTMTRDGPLSMCVHNAKRDGLILQPVELGGGMRWDPLTGDIVTSPDPRPGDVEALPLKRLKGRARARRRANRPPAP